MTQTNLREYVRAQQEAQVNAAVRLRIEALIGGLLPGCEIIIGGDVVAVAKDFWPVKAWLRSKGYDMIHVNLGVSIRHLDSIPNVTKALIRNYLDQGIQQGNANVSLPLDEVGGMSKLEATLDYLENQGLTVAPFEDGGILTVSLY